MKQLPYNFIEVEIVRGGKVSTEVVNMSHVIRVAKGPKENAFIWLTEQDSNGTRAVEYNGSVENFSKNIAGSF